MKYIREGVVQDTVRNACGHFCADCNQMAYSIMLVLIRGVNHEVPLCREHYLEACDIQPVLGYKPAKHRRNAADPAAKPNATAGNKPFQVVELRSNSASRQRMLPARDGIELEPLLTA
jgi:hypothetical protein